MHRERERSQSERGREMSMEKDRVVGFTKSDLPILFKRLFDMIKQPVRRLSV